MAQVQESNRSSFSGPRPGPRPRVAVVQDGARLHYAVPLALQQQGMLESLFTDWYCPRDSWRHTSTHILGALRPALAKRLRDRWHPALDDSRIVSSAQLTLQLRRREGDFASREAYFTWAAEKTAAWLRRIGLGNANHLHGYIRNIAPELCRWGRDQELVVTGDQIIAPAAIEAAEAARQRERWRDWVHEKDACDHDGVIGFERRTWDQLDHITCASNYVRQGLIEQGVAAQRISVSPYPIDASHFDMVDRSDRSGPVTVGFVGAVNLRKGAPYFCEVARHFRANQAQFQMVGPVGVNTEQALARESGVEFVGALPRSEVRQKLAAFDIFLFPSTCEGSAGAVMEAMATGLPVVVSPNSGSVVRDGIEGYIRPYDDIPGLIEAVRHLVDDRSARLGMGQAARRRVADFSIARYGQRIADLFLRLHS